jgi:hypothetical protein
VIIFGWFCLLALALVLTTALIAGVLVSRGFTGRVGMEAWFFLALASGAWWLVYYNFPFIAQVQQ